MFSLNRNTVLNILISFTIILLSVSIVNARYFVRDYSFDWMIYETDHFKIYYYEDESYLLEMTVESAEDAHARITDILDFETRKKIPLIVYKSHQEFEQTNLADGGLSEGVGGFTEMLRNRVVLPYTGSQEQFQKVLTHELVHAIMFEMLFASPISSMVTGGFIYPDEWFMEGLPELIADNWTPMGRQVLKDAVISGNLHTLEEIDDFNKIPPWEVYQAYKEGQSAVEYLVDNYGLDSITRIAKELRRDPTNDIDKALENVIGKSRAEFSEDWQLYLRRMYLPELEDKKKLKEYGTRLTSYEQRKDGIQFLSPDFTPSGELIACLSNEDRFLDITLINRETGDIFKNLTDGKGYDDYNYIQYMGNSLSFSSDGNRIAFVVRAQTRDEIYILDIISGDIVNKIKLPLDNLVSPSFSPNDRYLAFAGLKDGKQDIYIYDFNTGVYTNITNSPEQCDYPDWSPDGKKIVYTAKTITGEHLFLKDLNQEGTEQITFGEWSDIHPNFTSDGYEILFVSNRFEDTFNIFTYSLDTKQSTRRSNLLIGADRPTMSDDGEYIAFTGIEDGLYTVCVKETPLPIYYPIYDEIVVEEPELPELMKNPELLSDSREYSLDLQLDFAVSTFTYTTGGEFKNYTQLVLSDTLSDNRFAFLFDLTSVRSFEDIDAAFIYYNLSHRANIGVMAQSWRDLIARDNKGYYERMSGGAFMYSYPLSQKYNINLTPFFFVRKKEFIKPYDVESKRLLGTSVTLSRDTTLYGYYHPTSGSHQSIYVEQTFPLDGTGGESGDKSFLFYTNIIGDLRKYCYITDRNSLAMRLIMGTSIGRDPQKYFICGADTVRGYPLYSMYGNNFTYSNIELRFPIIDLVYTSIPGFVLGGFRGLLFFDAGTAWSNGGRGVEWDAKEPGTGFEPWKTEDGFKFHHIRTSFGFGFRWALFGVLDLRLDYAWRTNFQDIASKPYIHFSLGTEW